ncbi:MAG: MATE family efflux transporter [Muribaculaceae bacterium]|nr:MATE family efflux transporter [Muribaculaceae bacterium]
MKNNNPNNISRTQELAVEPIGKLLLKYSIPAVIGTVVMSIYNIIDSMVIGHAIDDPNVVAGIAVTFPVMNLATALGMLIGAGSATRISIVLGQKDHKRAELILGNSVVLTVLIGLMYMGAFALFLDPILVLFGASPNSLPYAHEFLMWILPGMVLINLTFSYNNVMRASGYPRKAMYTNLIGAGLNVILAPLFLFVFGWGIKGAAIATDISMLVTAIFVIGHFFRKDSDLRFVRGTFRLQWPVVRSIVYIGMAPFLINVAGSVINAIINNTLLKYGGDDAIAAVVVFNRFVTIFVMTVIGVCQGMQPILGYNYGAGNMTRLFRTLRMAATVGVIVTTVGCVIGALFPSAIARMFMQDASQIECAVNCLRITTLTFWMVGFQIVATNFFQSLGMAGKAVFLSLTRQIIFMIPMLFILPPLLGLDGVWGAFPVADFLSVVVSAVMLQIQVKKIRAGAK